jgi:hypothetical protein
MIRRLIEADYHQRTIRPPRRQMDFWLSEARTAELLVSLCNEFPRAAQRLRQKRRLLEYALAGDVKRTEQALRAEENAFRAADRDYWKPLRAELAAWRQQRKPTR